MYMHACMYVCTHACVPTCTHACTYIEPIHNTCMPCTLIYASNEIGQRKVPWCKTLHPGPYTSYTIDLYKTIKFSTAACQVCLRLGLRLRLLLGL